MLFKSIIPLFASLVLALGITGCQKEKQNDLGEQSVTATAGDVRESTKAVEDAVAEAIDESVPILPTDEFGNELPDPDQGSLEDERSGALEAAANLIKERAMRVPPYDPDQQ